MKRILPFLIFGIIGTSVALAQTEVVTLYDQVLSLPGCDLSGATSCRDVDNNADAGLQKTHRIERFVPGSGYLGVYFRNRSSSTAGAQGGFSFNDVHFDPLTVEAMVLGQGLQVFQRGTVVIEFVQPYTSTSRLSTEYEMVVYYLPHSEVERQSFLLQLQDDPAAFDQYKNRERSNIGPLCTALRGKDRVPSICPEPTLSVGPDETFDVTDSTFVSNPSILPESDFSGVPNRRPIVTLREEYRQVFVNQPVKVVVDQVYDPDGKCQIFQYRWQKPTTLQVQEVDLDPRLGDLSFTPLNTGVFTLVLRVREACEELGTLNAEPVRVRLIVHDKSTAFPDLDEAPQYQNAIYELYYLGVVSGYPDGTMRPNAPINRAEFLKILFETLDFHIENAEFSARYSDVLPGEWFAPYVWQADRVGIVKGYPDGRFHPEWTINLVEALKMALLFTTIEIKDDAIYNFPDVHLTDWFSRYVKTAYREGILDDISPGSFVRPAQLLTRGKAMQIVVRSLLYPVNTINYADWDALRRPDDYVDFSSFTY